MARPVKKLPEQWKREILEAAKELFLSKGYEETSITDIMELAGGAKGMFYRFFESKEEVMHALGDQMFLANNPFEAVRGRSALNGLQKIREVLALDRSDGEKEQIYGQAVSILKDPRILAAAIEANRRVLTPLWLMPSVFPANTEEILHKCRFLAEVLTAMGLPIVEKEMYERMERMLSGGRDES